MADGYVKSTQKLVSSEFLPMQCSEFELEIDDSARRTVQRKLPVSVSVNSHTR